jgi:hypothetical protein
LSSNHRTRSLLRAAGEAGPAPPRPAPDRTGQPDRDPATARPARGPGDGGGVYEPGQAVRWKRPGGSRWRYGHLGDDPVEADGGLRVYEDHNGAARTLRPSQVQRLVRGPRGGQRWQPCEPTPPPPGPTPLERLQHAAARNATAPKGMGL